MSQISAVVITFNEERNIERCLASLQNVADEIIVVDSFSTDRTGEICKTFNVKFHQRAWDDFSSAKNFGNGKASNDWILSLDADEALSDELKKNILEIKNKNISGNYKFNRITNYCGQWIRHCGWYPDSKTRLFLRTQGQWESTIHEQIIFKNSTQVHFLKGDILHYSYASIEDHLRQTEKYSAISAAELFSKGKKSSLLKVYISPAIKFIRGYFMQLGILDGYYGFVICRISAYSNYLKYNKLRYLNKK